VGVCSQAEEQRESKVGKTDKISTFLGEGTEFEGKLKFFGILRLDGHFKGEILGEGTLIVGEKAEIESDIRIPKLINSGKIQGQVVADKRVELLAPGQILGNIQTPCLVLNEGATLEGNCRMGEADKKDETEPSIITSDKPRISPSSQSDEQKHSQNIN
jgi:cytoskeletal protein CcmA (bactofilin family)